MRNSHTASVGASEYDYRRLGRGEVPLQVSDEHGVVGQSLGRRQVPERARVAIRHALLAPERDRLSVVSMLKQRQQCHTARPVRSSPSLL